MKLPFNDSDLMTYLEMAHGVLGNRKPIRARGLAGISPIEIMRLQVQLERYLDPEKGVKS